MSPTSCVDLRPRLAKTAKSKAGVAWTGKYLAFRAQATAVADADDDKTWRPDGSYIGVTVWNMMLSAGYMDRWWGPGWDGSLILSTSARPIPAITLERNYSDPFSVPVLKWLGPWRASIGLGALESHREDFDDTRVFEARVTFKPWKHLEIGLSRTALICGEGRPCDLGTFWDMFTGNDNDQDPVAAAGRPACRLRRAIFLALAPRSVRALRADDWRRRSRRSSEQVSRACLASSTGALSARGSYRVHVEYSDTACDFSRQSPQFDCAYESSIYTVGYRFRGRSIGHSIDSDSRLTTVGVLYVSPGSASWELVARDAKLNRDATTAPETAQTLAPLATDVESIDLFYRRDLLGGRLVAGAGFESREVSSLSSKDDEWRVMGQWVREF